MQGFSTGMTTRLGIAASLMNDPELLVWDEPTAGLSPAESHLMTALLKNLDPAITLLVIEHDMDVVFSLSERIIVLHRGEILCDGTPEEVRADAKVREVYLGDDVSDLFRYREEE